MQNSNISANRYLTQYLIGGVFYASYVYADSIEAAKELCRVRGIGEIIQGTSQDRSVRTKISLTEELHEACFLSFICLKSGRISIEEVLGDMGIVHELSHLISENKKPCPDGQIRARLEYLRRLTPGYEPV